MFLWVSVILVFLWGDESGRQENSQKLLGYEQQRDILPETR